MAFDFSREWPFFPDDEKLRIFEPRANVALLIGHTATDVAGATKVDAPLATLLERLPASIPPQQLAAVGTIATLRDGVERVVQNLLTNPYITTLVLCGDDSPVFYPLEGIRCLYAHGVDEGRHVIPDGDGGRAAKIFARDALATLSHEEIACFRRRELTIVDLRGALDPAEFFAEVARRLPELVRPVDSPSWQVLEEIDPYRWRPRMIQVGAGALDDSGIRVHGVGDELYVDGPGLPPIVANGKPDGRAQRAIHEVLRRIALTSARGWESRLASFGLAAERTVLATEFPADAAKLGFAVDEGAANGDTAANGHTAGMLRGAAGDHTPEANGPTALDARRRADAVVARASPLRLDPKGFFKIRVAYEQGTLAADYHEGGGRHVETLVAKRAEDLLAAIVGGEYLCDDPETRAQHLAYLAVQIGRADFALRTGLRFEEGQALAPDARKNVDHHLSACAVIAGGSLEETWIRGLAHLRDEGLLTTTQKGRVAEGWCTFFGIPDMGAITIPEAYPATDEHIDRYAAELLAPAPDVRARGDYTYGDRTCHYFFDQVHAAGARLAADPRAVVVNQRWVPEADLPAEAHHRPCLVFDVWFMRAGRLHTLQIARSHDVYGGLPQNALGIARGWGRTIAAAAGLPLGDLWFCSISNNFRVGDDAENVRRAIQGGVHAEPRVATLPPPLIVEVDEAAAIRAAETTARRSGDVTTDGSRSADAPPIRALWIPKIADRPARPVTDVLADTPVLAHRLLRHRGELDQVATVIARLRDEIARASRDRTNSLVLSPRDPRADRETEATPLLCVQVRRQLERLHAAAIVVGAATPGLVATVLDLQRAIAAAASLPAGSAVVVEIAP